MIERRIFGLRYYITTEEPNINSCDKFFVIPIVNKSGVRAYYVEIGGLSELELITRLTIRSIKRERVRDIAVQFYIPPDDFRQKTRVVGISHGDLSIKKDSMGNFIANLVIDVIPPGRREVIYVAQKLSLKPFKVSDTDWGLIKDSPIKYTHRGRLQNVNRPEIVKLANMLRGNNIYESVLRCVTFIKKHVRYHRNRYRLGCMFALKHGKGACDEITDLCASILKAMGIRTRTIIGYVIGESFHAWIEVFTNRHGWVPIDATAGIIGGIGARWIKFFTEPKPGAKILNVSSRGKISAKLEYMLESEKLM